MPENEEGRPSDGGDTPDDEKKSKADEGKDAESKEGKSATETPATEKPVASQRRISRYIVFVEDDTGVIPRIEKLDPKTRQSRELTSEEYAMAYAFASYSAPYYSALAASLYDPLNSSAMRAYYRGISAYVKALTRNP